MTNGVDVTLVQSDLNGPRDVLVGGTAYAVTEFDGGTIAFSDLDGGAATTLEGIALNGPDGIAWQAARAQTTIASSPYFASTRSCVNRRIASTRLCVSSIARPFLEQPKNAFRELCTHPHLATPS